MNALEIKELAKEVVLEEKRGLRKINFWTILGGSTAVIVVWIFTAGQMHAEVKANTETNATQQKVIEHVPKLKVQMENVELSLQEIKKSLERNDDEAKEAIKGLRVEQQQMRQEILNEIRLLR